MSCLQGQTRYYNTQYFKYCMEWYACHKTLKCKHEQNNSILLSSLITYHLTLRNTIYPNIKTGSPRTFVFKPVFMSFVWFDLQFSVQCFIDHCLSFCPFPFGHCIVCLFVPSYLVIVLSVFLSLPIWSSYCLSFNLQLLIPIRSLYFFSIP